MDVYANWCGPCKLLDKHTFSNKDLIEYVNENFYAVKFNGEGIEEIYFYDRVFNNPKYDPKRKGKKRKKKGKRKGTEIPVITRGKIIELTKKLVNFDSGITINMNQNGKIPKLVQKYMFSNVKKF